MKQYRNSIKKQGENRDATPQRRQTERGGFGRIHRHHPNAVEKQIAKLKAEGVLKRIGPDKGGYWQVVK